MKEPIKPQRALKNRKKKLIWKIFKGLLAVLKFFDLIYSYFDRDS